MKMREQDRQAFLGRVLITGIENVNFFVCINVSTSLWKKGRNASQRGCTLSYLRNKFWSQSLKPLSGNKAVPLSPHTKEVVRALNRCLCSLSM